MTAHISWRQTSCGRSALLSAPFWGLALREARIFTLIFAELLGGALAHRSARRNDGYLSLLIMLPLVAVVLLLYALLMDAQVSARFAHVLRRRAGWHFNFALGLVAALPRIAVVFFAVKGEQSFAGTISEQVVITASCIASMWLRNAGVQAQVLWILYFTYKETQNDELLETLVVFLHRLPAIVLSAVVGAAETSQETRLILMLIWCMMYVFSTARWNLEADYAAYGVFMPYLLGHLMKGYWHGRDVRHWAGPLVFLKFSEVRRRRSADRRFVLARRQEQDSDLFGDPVRARYIIVVSHAWLRPTHADPDGVHLDLLINRLEERFLATPSSALLKWWKRYYFMDSEGDVLFFFDMSSLHQLPRTLQEDHEFHIAFGLMNFLYYSFEVLVITEIPAAAQQHGRHLSYMDKGWCWAEASIARVGGKLDHFSREVIDLLDKDDHIRASHGLSLSDSLSGYPKFPPELLEFGREEELMKFRDKQTVRGKVFTNGKFDTERVARLLLVFEKKQQLRELLTTGDSAGVIQIFADDSFFTPLRSGIAKLELANTVFDSNFTTPLHLAVAADCVPLVEVLLAAGAQPKRNFNGCLPWEHLIIRQILAPRFSLAARAAQAACLCE